MATRTTKNEMKGAGKWIKDAVSVLGNLDFGLKFYGEDNKMTRKTNKKSMEIESFEWLMVGKRIKKLSWERLAKIYYANRAGSKIRKAIDKEARACGYTPCVILGINFC